MGISRGKEYEKLEENLNKVLTITQLLSSDFENGTNLIRE